jgi:pyruvate dehydrogenase E2 component (dihydrolipoyllysine-residue acetyltransferase)
MATEIPMPRLSDTMERGTVARWAKKEGDSIAEGDVLADIETDKATMELESYENGVLLKILVQEGESAELGAPIALVGEAGETVEAPQPNGDAPATPTADAPAPAAEPGAGASEPPKTEAPKTERAAPAARPAPQANGGGELRASPIARRMAADAGLDLRPLAGRGSGPDGRIVKVDVERLAAEGSSARAASAPPTTARSAPPPAPVPGAWEGVEGTKPTGMQRAVARRMTESKQNVPHFYLQSEVDMTRAIELRREINRSLGEGGTKVSINDLIIRACAVSLIEHPQFHRSWLGDRIVHHEHAHIGIAVALDDGLIVPVLRDADRMTLTEIAAATKDIVARARSGKVRQHEIEGGTFTVSNLGMFGVTSFEAIINPPEPGILAVGRTIERPVIVDGQVVARPIMAVTLSVDHRAASGADGARLLQAIVRRLEGGVTLLL